MREHTPYDIVVKHALDTRGKEARAEMDAALLRLAAELEADARKSERVVTVAGTVGFVLISVFIPHTVSGWIDGTALLAPAFANAIFGAAIVAGFITYAYWRRKDRLIELERRGKQLEALSDPALAPVREVLRDCLDGAYAVFDRDDVQVDRPVFGSPLAAILFLPLQRHRNYRLPNAERPFAEQLKAVRALQTGPVVSGVARSGAAARNIFLDSATSLLFVHRIDAVVDYWGNPRKGEKLKQALIEVRELTNERPSLNDTDLAKQVAARLAMRGIKIGLSDSTSTEWLEQVLGGTGDYGWIHEYLSGDDKAIPEKRTTKRRA